jgi:acyl-CoA reductase-like NAD-dependent aldehyde dehydrogenase
MELLKGYGSFIDNELVKGRILLTISIRLPGKRSSGLPARTAPSSTGRSTARAQAFETWKNTSRGGRGRILRAMADRLADNLDYLAEVETLESGRTLGESKIHVGGAIDCYRYFASAIEMREETLVCHDSGSFSAVVREPLGVAGLIIPWNASTMGGSWKIAPAIATGNTIVIKPSASGALPIVEAARLWADILPDGVLNVVAGTSETIGDYFTAHPGFNKLTFTGSTEVGRKIGETAGRNLIPATLELGGKSANIIFEDANLDRALQKAIIGILSTAGEVCIAGSRLLLQESVYDRFLMMLREKFEGAVLGDPMDPKTQLGPVIDEKQMNKVLRYIRIGEEEGATLVCGGYRYTDNGCENGFFIAPTIFGDVNNTMRIAREEIFGPVLCVLKFKTEEEAVGIANDSVYGLGAAVWTKDINRAIRVSRALQAGTIWVNDYLDSSPGNPFGGYKQSGYGREVHKMAMDHYTQVKNICVADTDFVPPVW